MGAERAAATLAIEELTELFNRAYTDYFVPMHLVPEVLRTMIATQDIDLEGSRVITEGGAPVAFAMLGVRGARGWIGGMGVVPEARRTGLGRRVMEAVLEAGRARGLATIALEVLEPNAPAIALYERLGFRHVRWLEILERGAHGGAGMASRAQPTAGRASAEPETVPVAECLARYAELHPEPPPWQREPVVLERSRDLSAMGVRGGSPGGELRACTVVRADPSRILLFAAGRARDASDAGLAAAIAAAAPRAELPALMLNVPERDPAAAVLRGLGFAVRLRQREMILALDRGAAS